MFPTFIIMILCIILIMFVFIHNCLMLATDPKFVSKCVTQYLEILREEI